MSSTGGLMDTEVGGEQTQYEGEHTHTEAHKKSGGQLSDPATTSATSSTKPVNAEAKADRGAQTAENIRYGQNMSESGMGGKTTTSSGGAEQEDGSGAGAGAGPDTEGAASTREESGYGGDRDMDPEIGA